MNTASKITKIPSIYVDKEVEMFKLNNNIYALSTKNKNMSICNENFSNRVYLTVEDVEDVYNHITKEKKK